MERRAQRYNVWLPVQVDELDAGMAIGHDASARGLLMVSANTMELGALVSLTVKLPPDLSRERTVKARVVRVEANDEDPEGMWPHRIALEFEGPDEEIERALRELEEQGVARKKQ